MSDAPPRSVWSRSAALVTLAAGLARKELGSRVARGISRGGEVADALRKARVQIEQARAVVESLGKLKGAAMKAGQLLSIELRDVLPPEASEILGKLQDQAAPVSWAEIRSILEEELGSEALSALEIEEQPLASASIGQVHRARWTRPSGEKVEVVLKVQFRGIADTIESDLALLERIAGLLLTVQRKEVDLSALFTELRTMLVRETDYRAEADFLEAYRALAHRTLGLRVPEVYRELSTARVLALSYERGLKLDAFLAQEPSEAARHRVAVQLLDLFFLEFFEWGLVQTDANFANFLFRPESGELVLLDFGATRSYDEVFRARYRSLLSACLGGDFETTLSHATGLGLIDPREGPESRAALYALLQTVLQVFRDEAQPVDFRDKKLPEESSKRLFALYRMLERSAPPAQLLFLHRKLGGVYALGKALGARLDLLPFRRRLDSGGAAAHSAAGR